MLEKPAKNLELVFPPLRQIAVRVQKISNHHPASDGKDQLDQFIGRKIMSNTFCIRASAQPDRSRPP